MSESEERAPAGGAGADMYVLYLLAFTVELGLGIVSPLLPEIMREFHLAAWQIGMMVTVHGLARLLTDLPLGVLLDRLDRTRILTAGTLLIVAGSLGVAMMQDYTLLLVARLVMGMGTALCLVTILFTVSRGAHAKSRGKAIGLYQASCLAGITFSPAIGGAAASLFGWRSAFLFCAFTGAVAMMMVAAASRRGTLRLPPASQRQEDPPTAHPSGGRLRQIPWSLVAINYTTLVLFLSANGFRNSVVPVYGGTYLAIGAGTLGLLLGGSAVIRFLVTLFSGIASDRYGRKVILFPGVMLLAAGSLSFSLASSLPEFALCLVVISLGGFGNSLPTTMLVDAVSGGKVGFAISVNRFMADFGTMVGPVALGWVLDTAGFPSVTALTAAMLLTTIPGIAATFHEKSRSEQTVPARG